MTAVFEVEHGIAEHIHKTFVIGRVIEQPSSEDEVEWTAGIEYRFRAVGDDEFNAFVTIVMMGEISTPTMALAPHLRIS